MSYYRRCAVINAHISEMNDTGISMFSDIYKKIIKYYDSFDQLFQKEEMYNERDWAFINDPNSPEFKDLESVAIFYYYKQTVFEKYYDELNLQAAELINQIERELNL